MNKSQASKAPDVKLLKLIDTLAREASEGDDSLFSWFFSGLCGVLTAKPDDAQKEFLADETLLKARLAHIREAIEAKVPLIPNPPAVHSEHFEIIGTGGGGDGTPNPTNCVSVTAVNDFGVRVLVGSGVLIAPQIVLTASHVVPADDSTVLVQRQVHVGFGEHALAPIDSAVAVDSGSVIGATGLSLVHLAQPVTIPIALIPLQDNLQSGPAALRVGIAGFGIDNDNGSGTRHAGIAVVIGVSDERLEIAGVIPTDPNRNQICQGDSGGPMYSEPNVLIGIAQATYFDCHSGGWFTRVSSLRADIMQAAGSL